MGWGPVCSLALHVLVALLLTVLLPGPMAPPPVEEVIPLELVQLGEKTASPLARNKGELPQETAPESPRTDPATAAPEPAATPTPVQPPAAARHRPAKPGPKPEPSPPEDFDSRLRAAERAQQQAPVTSDPRSRSGHGAADRAVASSAGESGPRATYSVKDFVRAQIERRWNFDVAALGSSHWVVSIHLVLEADGTVQSATIVDAVRFKTEPDYHALALSARDAALLSSPLHLPPGTPSALRDMILDFDPRAALR